MSTRGRTPPQPPESSWRFVADLKAPLHSHPVRWTRRAPGRGRADLRAGVTLALVLKALERGMHAAAPDAELISWPYGQWSSWGKAWTVAGAGARYVDIRGGTPRYDWHAQVRREAAAWEARIRIPWRALGRAGGARLPARLNVSRYLPGRDPVTSVHTYRWVSAPAELAARRNSWNGVPVGLGWIR